MREVEGWEPTPLKEGQHSETQGFFGACNDVVDSQLEKGGVVRSVGAPH